MVLLDPIVNFIAHTRSLLLMAISKISPLSIFDSAMCSYKAHTVLYALFYFRRFYLELFNNLKPLKKVIACLISPLYHLRRRKEQEQLAALRGHHQEEIDHHKKEIERLQQEISRHEGKIRKLKHDD